MRFAPRTILGQLVAGSVLVQVTVFAIFMAFGMRRELREAKALDRRRLMRQTRTLTDVLQEPLVNSDPVMLDYVMRAVPVSRTIGSVRITDSAGNTLRTSSRRLPPTLNERERSMLSSVVQQPAYRLLKTESGADEGVQPVVTNGVVRGIVWITPDLSDVRRFSIMDVENVSTYAVCALLGNLLLVWWLSASMARPLRQLRQATLHVQAHPNDFSAFPLPADVHNEAGELQQSFNSMVEEIVLQRRGTQETLNLLDAMLESAPVGFAFFDREFRFVRLNQSLARMHGVALASHVGKRYRDLLPRGYPTESAMVLEGLIAEVFRSGSAITDHEMAGATPGSKESHSWQITLFPVCMADELRWVGIIVTDVTERRRAEEAIRRSDRITSAGRLAASIVYEINNPLESVTNLLYLLRSNNSLDVGGQQYVAMAEAEMNRVARTTQQTLQFYRQSSSPTDVRLPELLRSVLDQARLRSLGIELKLHLCEDAVAFGHQAELRQVFANLVRNAMEAMPAGGTLYVRARTARRLGKHGTRVTVADTGAGLPGEKSRGIVQPFFSTKEVAGTVLELWDSADILERHRATLTLRSRVAPSAGQKSGSVFAIFFPQDGVSRGPIRLPAAIRMPDRTT